MKIGTSLSEFDSAHRRWNWIFRASFVKRSVRMRCEISTGI